MALTEKDFYLMHIDEIDEIMDNFNFAKTKKVLDFLNWKMALCEQDTYKGTILYSESQLRTMARQLLKTAMIENFRSYHKTKDCEYHLETGCFRVESCYDPISGPEPFYKIALYFVVESYDPSI